MCNGERIHEKEIAAYLGATTVVRRVTKNCRRDVASSRHADAYLALWKLLLERLSGDDHDRWCALLRGPVTNLDAALLRSLRWRWLDEVRATEGTRRLDLPKEERAFAGERVGSAFYADAASGVETLVDELAEAARVRAAIAALPRNERLVIERVDLDDQSFAEVARGMGVGESTVRYWRASGLRRLREHIGERATRSGT